MAPKEKSKPFIFYSDKLQFKSVDGPNGKSYYVTGYISTGDIDLVNDIVTKGCMDSMLTQFDDKTIKLDFEHEAFRGKSELEIEANKTKIVLGKAIGHERDSKGVKVTWELNSTWKKFDEKGNVTMTFKDIWSNVEKGFYDAFSIAYVPTRTSYVEREGKDVRLLDHVNLLNVALTGNPINPGASMTAVMAKSLAFMKENETKDNKEIVDFSLVEIKTNIDSLNSEVSNIKKNMEIKNMEKKDENLEAEVKDKTPVVVPEAKAEDKPKEDAKKKEDEDEEKKPESKSLDNAELKSLTERIDSLDTEVKAVKKENAELKAIVEKAQHKSLGTAAKESTATEEKSTSTGPLDMIR